MPRPDVAAASGGIFLGTDAGTRRVKVLAHDPAARQTAGTTDPPLVLGVLRALGLERVSRSVPVAGGVGRPSAQGGMLQVRSGRQESCENLLDQYLLR